MATAKKTTAKTAAPKAKFAPHATAVKPMLKDEMARKIVELESVIKSERQVSAGLEQKAESIRNLHNSAQERIGQLQNDLAELQTERDQMLVSKDVEIADLKALLQQRTKEVENALAEANAIRQRFDQFERNARTEESRMVNLVRSAKEELVAVQARLDKVPAFLRKMFGA